MSNFDKIKEFHNTFGLPVETTPRLDVFDNDPKLVNLRMNLIREEVSELEEAVKNHDMVETVDAMADILYVVYGMGTSFGIDLDEAYRLVHDSNMSKVCRSEEEAIETVKWYKENMLNTYDTPTYKPSKCGTYWIVFNESSGKVLKSINYHPVDLKPLVNK